MTQSVSISDAARHFDVTAETVRRWIRSGAPCVVPGEVGRGHGARLNLQDLARWRASRSGSLTQPDDLMNRIETALFDVLRRDGGTGRTIAQEIGITGEQAATMLAHVLSRITRELNGGG